jgi:hypothetical protein
MDFAPVFRRPPPPLEAEIRAAQAEAVTLDVRFAQPFGPPAAILVGLRQPGQAASGRPSSFHNYRRLPDAENGYRGFTDVSFRPNETTPRGETSSRGKVKSVSV